MNPKLLVIRFSSIGDIIQALGIPQAFKTKWPNAEVHWLAKQEFSFIPESNPSINKVISLPQGAGIFRLMDLAWGLRRENYTHVYDAHNNFRSHMVVALLSAFFKSFYFLRRSKERWKRFLFFKFRKRNLFLMPYRGQYSYLKPLSPWLGKTIVPPAPQMQFAPEVTEFLKKRITVSEPFIALAPSAAWTMKRWPQEHWKNLIEMMPDMRFVILGGPHDHFCEKYQMLEPERVQNLAGKLTLTESCAVLNLAKLLISNDTGLLHAADQMGVPAIALIGPTAFGYPTRPTSHIMEVHHLPCKPCTKDGSGKCQRKTFRQCLVDLSPAMVVQKTRALL